MPSIRTPIALLLAPALLMGCYTYTTIEPTAAVPGKEVRARVSPAMGERLGTLGLSDTRNLSGKVVDNQAGALTIEVPSAPLGTMGAEQGLFQRIVLGRGDLIELEAKHLDRTRTNIAIGVGAVATGAIIASIVVRGRSSGQGPVTEPPPTFSIGILRFHF